MRVTTAEVNQSCSTGRPNTSAERMLGGNRYSVGAVGTVGASRSWDTLSPLATPSTVHNVPAGGVLVEEGVTGLEGHGEEGNCRHAVEVLDGHSFRDRGVRVSDAQKLDVALRGSPWRAHNRRRSPRRDGEVLRAWGDAGPANIHPRRLYRDDLSGGRHKVDDGCSAVGEEDHAASE